MSDSNHSTQLCRQDCCSRGALQAEVPVPGGSQAKSVCPRGALQAEVSISGGLQAKFGPSTITGLD